MKKDNKFKVGDIIKCNLKGCDCDGIAVIVAIQPKNSIVYWIRNNNGAAGQTETLNDYPGKEFINLTNE